MASSTYFPGELFETDSRKGALHSCYILLLDIDFLSIKFY